MPSILPPADRRSVALVTTYAAVSLLLLLVGDHVPFAWLRGTGAFLFAPFDRVVLAGNGGLAAWRENASLHERVARLELDNARLAGEDAENRRLRAQLGLTQWRGLPLKPVEILALGGDPVPTSATLSAGRRSGVHAGDALLTSDGLVGRVVEVWPALSRAVLLTDPNLAIACEVETTGVHGILHWVTGRRSRLQLTAVPLADTIRVGERVVTSDLSIRFPRGIPVGVVTALHQDATGLMQEVDVRPSAQLSRLRHAFVVPGPVAPEADSLPRPHVEFEPRRIAPPRPRPAGRDSLARARHAGGGAR